jgi:cold shock protein
MQEQGTVKLWISRGYGFIRPDRGGDDVFVHVHELDRDYLREGARILFDIEETPKGLKAVNCTVIE